MKPKAFSLKEHDKRGVASLPTVLALTILILAVGVGIASLAFVESFVGVGQVYSSQALSYAEAGARDALLKIARNKNYTCSSADCYSIDMASGGCSDSSACARVSVSAGVGTSGDPKIITSKGQAKNKTRRVQINVVYDASGNGEIQSAAWQEIQ